MCLKKDDIPPIIRESGEQFEIQIANERVYVPVRAKYNIEHEREDGSEEIEFQIKWDKE